MDNRVETKYKCLWPGCDQSFNKKNTFKAHMTRHSVTVCKDSETIAEDSDQLIFGDNTKRRKPKFSKKKNKTIGFKCDSCNYWNPTASEVEGHKNRVHLKVKPYKCNNCTKAYASATILKEHMRRIHSGTKYSCEATDCNYTTRDYRLFELHQKRHLGLKPFLCEWPACGRSFLTKGVLNSHMSIHSGIEYRCDWEGCEYFAKSEKRLKQHAFIHTGLRPYGCEWPGCEDRFVRLDHLRVHMLVHKNERTFICDFKDCGKSFNTKTHLARHRSVHDNQLGIKPFACEWPGCESRFARRDYLNSHMSIHGEVRKHVCHYPECDKRFHNKSGLNVHLKLHKREAHH